MSCTRGKMIDQLKKVLPYADDWYKGLADKQVFAIHKKELRSIVAESIRRDEEATRRKAGLEPKNPRYEQLNLF